MFKTVRELKEDQLLLVHTIVRRVLIRGILGDQIP